MKLLVLLDGSRFAEAILPPASALARAGSAEVSLVAVINPAEVKGTWLEPASPGAMERGTTDPLLGHGLPVDAAPKGAGRLVEDVVQAAERAKTEAKEYLLGIARKHFGRGAGIVVLEGEDVADEVLAYVREQKPDVVALATHGRTGLARLVMGSVTNRLLGAGIAPLLLIRPNALPPLNAEPRGLTHQKR